MIIDCDYITKRPNKNFKNIFTWFLFIVLLKTMDTEQYYYMKKSNYLIGIYKK